jgi:hypothetical protein
MNRSKRWTFYRSFTSVGYSKSMDRKPPRTTIPPEQEGPPLKPRRTTRIAVEQPARMRSQALYQIEVKVRDVSTCGFMAECAAPVPIGSYVSLEVPGVGPVHAQVRWQIGTSMGGMFLDPISLVRCEWTAVKADSAIPA